MNSSPPPKDQKVVKILKDIQAQGIDYPEELLSARRAAFMETLEQRSVAEIEDQSSIMDQKVIDLLGRLKSISVRYPTLLWYARRADFMRRIAWMNWVSLWAALWSTLQDRVPLLSGVSWTRLRRAFPASLMAASFALAAVAGILFYEKHEPITNLFRSRYGVVRSARIVKEDTREVRIICKPGYEPPLCLAGEFESESDLSYQGNGIARPAVAKDTAPDYGSLNQAAYVNDGLYGPGAGWISNSKYSWIKIDLGKVTAINTVKFGRDRLGKLNDGDPGRFIIAVALSDNIYANGNSSNDEREYRVIYDSRQTGFEGTISGPETVIAQFGTRVIRYIKITFQNKGTAVDEVEAFLVRPPVLASSAGSDSENEEPRDPSPSTAANTSPPSFTRTSIPEDIPTLIPTFTVFPTNTAALLPTRTPLPTRTFTSVPTNTRVPTDTATPVPTSTPLPTDTPAPTDTPFPTDTPPPPDPTDTPPPPDPTDTPVPTDTEVAPTDTLLPEEWMLGYINYLTQVPFPP